MHLIMCGHDYHLLNFHWKLDLSNLLELKFYILSTDVWRLLELLKDHIETRHKTGASNKDKVVVDKIKRYTSLKSGFKFRIKLFFIIIDNKMTGNLYPGLEIIFSRRAREDSTKQNSEIWAKPDETSHFICWLWGGSRHRRTNTLNYILYDLQSLISLNDVIFL